MPLQVDLLEESFDLVVLRGDDLLAGFYRRVLSQPRLAGLFEGVAMNAQKLKFLGTLLALRQSWRDLGAMEQELALLGERHHELGVRPDHYPLVCTALLAALAETGGSAWKPEYTLCWQEAYTAVQEAMLRGARPIDSAAGDQHP